MSKEATVILKQPPAELKTNGVRAVEFLNGMVKSPLFGQRRKGTLPDPGPYNLPIGRNFHIAVHLAPCPRAIHQIPAEWLRNRGFGAYESRDDDQQTEAKQIHAETTPSVVMEWL